MRAKPRRLVRATWLDTRTATFSPATGLTTGGFVEVATRNCVDAVSDGTVKLKPPVAVVSSVLATLWKPPVNGKALAWRLTARFALCVPESVPCTVTAPPNGTGLGEERIASDSG